MLYHICQIRDTLKCTACKVAIFNLIFSTVLIGFKIAIVILSANENHHLADHPEILRTTYLMVTINLILYPFDLALIIGTYKDRLSWLRKWLICKIIQCGYIITINLISLFFLLHDGAPEVHGVALVVYTVFVEMIFMEVVIYVNNYRSFKLQENQLAVTKQPIDIIKNLA